METIKNRAITYPKFEKMMDQIITLGLTELAQILKKSRRSVGNDVSRAPWRLPPPIRRCGKQPLWLFDDVKKWLSEPDQPQPDALKKGPGRPKKTRTLPSQIEG
jgi:hypothetical protein